ncbi:hypothetical protein [Corynebacterium marquesiae]
MVCAIGVVACQAGYSVSCYGLDKLVECGAAVTMLNWGVCRAASTPFMGRLKANRRCPAGSWEGQPTFC